MDKNDPVLKLQKISKKFGGLQVLQNIDLELNQKKLLV